MLFAHLERAFRRAGFALILLIILLLESKANAQTEYTISNLTTYDLFLAQGEHVDKSISGIGGSGWDDPNPHINAKGFQKIPARLSHL